MSWEERKAREEREAAALRIKVRGVARVIGARVLDDEEAQHRVMVELAPTVHLWARRSWEQKGMIAWTAHCPHAQGYSAPGVCTSLTRPAAAIAEDIRRRLLPAAREWCKSTMGSAAQTRNTEHARQAEVAELEQNLGPMAEAHDGTHYTDGFSIRHDDLLGGDYNGRYRAEVRVYSWHCLLMIARLVAEDERVARAEGAASANGEETKGGENV
jgi:hypothetical protein